MTERIVAVIPVGELERAKSRLGEVLDAEERRDLVIALLERTLAATAGSSRIVETLVVTPDDEVASLARAAGARVIRQSDRGLNHGLDEARAAAVDDGATALLVLPADLPGVSPSAVDGLLDALDETPAPLVAIVPDRHGRGTNGLLLAPPDVIDFAFGGDSRVAHRHAADAASTRVVELDGPLSLDIDTPEDLLLVQTGELAMHDAR
jgi:2-phospho-L-lactate guanylyltransferase